MDMEFEQILGEMKDRGAWRAAIHRVAKGRHDLAT